MTFSKELKKFILEKGAADVGFADITHHTPIKGLDRGIAFYIAYEAEVIQTIEDRPTVQYLDALISINEKLDEIAVKTEEFLKEHGFEAYSQTRANVSKNLKNNSSLLPHKTVATLGGLGWIGKSALFVTEKYGSAVRLSSVLTDADLDLDNPVASSLCGDCRICQDACPAGAVGGANWNIALKREDLFSHELCEQKARELCLDAYGKEDTVCGICIRSCPHTSRYLNTNRNLKK